MEKVEKVIQGQDFSQETMGQQYQSIMKFKPYTTLGDVCNKESACSLCGGEMRVVYDAYLADSVVICKNNECNKKRFNHWKLSSELYSMSSLLLREIAVPTERRKEWRYIYYCSVLLLL